MKKAGRGKGAAGIRILFRLSWRQPCSKVCFQVKNAEIDIKEGKKGRQAMSYIHLPTSLGKEIYEVN